MRRRIKDCQWLTCPRKGRMVLNNSFHSREADPHVIKNPPSGNGCCETAEHFTYTGYLSSRSVKAVTSMATFSIVYNILHHPHASSSSPQQSVLGWEVAWCCVIVPCPHCPTPAAGGRGGEAQGNFARSR